MAQPGAAWQREEIADSFVDGRRDLIPLMEGQQELVRWLLIRHGRRIGRFLDLGAGAGAFARLVMDSHPGSTGVLVDFSPPMVAAAAEQLSSYGERWEYVRGDLASPRWRADLPPGAYGAIVSSLCIHHLPHERKRALYEEAYELLEPGGLFLNWDHVATDALSEGMLEEWLVDRLLEAERQRERPHPAEDVVREFREAADEDILLDADTQARWLQEIGFERVAIWFKLPELAIFGGVKGGE
jgi:tRNA (cmo5U34)-methyltransferase